MIFNLFKSKPTLIELIPEGFVDIHSHILPGIDDGAKNIEESLLLISEMKKMGFSKIIGTSHTYPGLYNNTNESIKNSFNKLVKNMNVENINIDFGSEYMIDESLIIKSRNKDFLCIKDNYVLLEMNFISEPIGLYEIIYEICINGYIPVIAHPERYLYIENKFSIIEKLKNMGCKFQLNLLSTVGSYGIQVTKFSDKLLNMNYIDFVGSDIHNTKHIKMFEDKIKISEIGKLEEIMKNNSFYL